MTKITVTPEMTEIAEVLSSGTVPLDWGSYSSVVFGGFHKTWTQEAKMDELSRIVTILSDPACHQFEPSGEHIEASCITCKNIDKIRAVDTQPKINPNFYKETK
jgi:hypothetical protein